MKTSIINYIIENNADAFSNVATMPGQVARNILDPDSKRTYAVDGNLNIDIIGLDDVNADVICLFNLEFEGTIIIDVYNSANILQETGTFTESDLTGFFNKALYYELQTTTVVHRIVITTSGSDTFEEYIGFIWVGNWLDLECFESAKIQPFSVSNDDVNVTRTNRPKLDESYRYRSFDVTLKKEEDFQILRIKMEQILLDGFGKPRPWLLEEQPFNGELYYGVMDSGKVGYDIFDFDPKNLSGNAAQTTIGIREVT